MSERTDIDRAARGVMGTAATFSVAALLLLSVARTASAQGEISGRVLSPDSGRPPVQGAEASIAKLGRRALSDSAGRFRLKDVPPGEHVVFLRAIGFRSESSVVMIDQDEVVSWDVVLTRSTGTVLPGRVITAPGERVEGKLAEFTERRTAGVGHFISRDELAKAEGGLRKTGDLIGILPGVSAKKGSNKVWIATGRASSTGCAFCTMSVEQLSQYDVAAGARPACYMDVYLDGAMVFDSRHPENGLFDVNSIPPEHIGGIEVYTSAAQIPAKYNRTGNGCGVLLIWTR